MVIGLVSWMYLLPDWVTPWGQPVCERLRGTMDMLVNLGTSGELKSGGREVYVYSLILLGLC